MKFYKTQAIVLKRKNFRESDKILTFYTLNYGKIIAIAKGAQKTKSKMAGYLEPFYLVDLRIVEGKKYNIISETKLIKSFKNIQKNLKKTILLYFIAEIIDKMVEENEKNPQIFYLLQKTLEYTNLAKKIDLILPYFIINFLEITGFKPILDFCIQCHLPIKEEKKAIYFSFKEGGVLCNKCKKNLNKKISLNTIKFLKMSENFEINFLSKIKTNKDSILEIQNLLIEYLEFISEKKFNTSKFWKKIQKTI